MAIDTSAIHHHEDDVAAKSPHVLVVPFYGQGHINPCLSIAHYLAASGISVTLVQPRSAASTDGHHAAAETLPFRTETIPTGFDDSQPSFSMETLRASLDVMHSALVELLHKLMLEENAPVCLLIDSFFGWGDAVAVEFGLTRVDLWTASASVFCLCVHVQDILARGFIPATEEEAKDRIVDFIPGLSSFRIADMPKDMAAPESDKFLFFHSLFQNAKSADRILVNTMYELETSAVDALRREDHVHMDPVGPLYTMSMAPTSSVGLIPEDKSCLLWLDRQQQSSVLYVAFGSIASLEDSTYAELAHGLEASGESFLWVIRPDSYKNKASVEEILPEGFMDRTRGRGLVISWAPQLAVLGHPSVGAFLTHCGWNSILESLSNGVPMLGYPQMAEQNTNLKFIVHDWKVGLPFLQDQGDTRQVERTGVRTAVTEIMKGEKGLHVRERAHEWKEIAQKAIHGSSKENLQKLVDDLKHGRLKHSKH